MQLEETIPDPDTTVVVDHYDNSYHITSYDTHPGNIKEYYAATVSENPDAEPPKEIVVQVYVHNPDRWGDVVVAAQRLEAGLLRLRQKLLSSADGVFSTRISQHSNAELLSELDNIQWTVENVDPATYGNNGLGQASRVEGGINQERSSLTAITQYTDSSFPDQTKIVAYILHELGHMTVAGDQLFRDSLAQFNAEPADHRGSFYGGDYAANLERFANSFMNSAADFLGFNLHGVTPGNYYGAPMTAEEISQSRGL